MLHLKVSVVSVVSVVSAAGAGGTLRLLSAPAPAANIAIGGRYTSGVGPRPHPGGTGRMRLKYETRQDGR